MKKTVISTAYSGGSSLESMIGDCRLLEQDPDIVRAFIQPTFFSDGSYDLSVCFEVVEGVDPRRKAERFWYEFLGMEGA